MAKVGDIFRNPQDQSCWRITADDGRKYYDIVRVVPGKRKAWRMATRNDIVSGFLTDWVGFGNLETWEELTEDMTLKLLCPKCDKRLPLEGDYLCKRCRYG